jgi:hypothetical protein
MLKKKQELVLTGLWVGQYFLSVYCFVHETGLYSIGTCRLAEEQMLQFAIVIYSW